MKILLATDLDGTLITEQEGSNRILALETEHGKSYITKKNLERLRNLSKNIDIMPLTTRSEASFRRFDVGIEFKYALIENGGCLLNRGSIDNAWKEESKKLMMVAKDSEMFCRIYLEERGYAVKSSSTFVIDYINKEISLEDTIRNLSELQDMVGDELDVVMHAKGQIFAVHKSLRKECGLKRFLKEHKYDAVITCGDIQADWGMLKDFIGIGLDGSPAKYKFSETAHKKDNQAFTEFLLSQTEYIVKKLREEGD